MSEIGEVLRDRARQIKLLTRRISDWRNELKTERSKERRLLIIEEISHLKRRLAVGKRNLDRDYNCPYAIEFG